MSGRGLVVPVRSSSSILPGIATGASRLKCVTRYWDLTRK